MQAMSTPKANPAHEPADKAAETRDSRRGQRTKETLDKSKSFQEPVPWECGEAGHSLMKALTTKRFVWNSSYIKCSFHAM